MARDRVGGLNVDEEKAAPAGSVMRTLLALVMGLIVSVAAVSVAADPTRPQQDRQGPVTVGVSLVPGEAAGPTRVKVMLDTHSVDLERIELRNAVVMRLADGREVPPSAIEQATGDGHHRQAVLVFPAAAEGPVLVVVKNIGNVPERVFRWDSIGR